jgi:hypothetical protein
MNPNVDDLSREERAALRKLREQVRRQQQAQKEADLKTASPVAKDTPRA